MNSLNNVLNNAVSDSVISTEVKNLIDLSDTVVLGASGFDVDQIDVSEVYLVTLIIDDSGSIRYSGLEQAIRDGQNNIVDAFQNSKQKDLIMMAQWTLNSKAPLHSYVPMEQVVRLTDNNYNANGFTPLYDTIFDAITSNVLYAQKLKDMGTPVNNIIVVLTDGLDEGSRKYNEKQVAKLIRDVSKETFSVVFIGVAKDSKSEDDFIKVAKSMGINEGNIKNINASPSEIRKICAMVSQSIIKMSQGIIDPNAQNSFFD